MIKKYCILILLLSLCLKAECQLKFIIEDFEGLSNGTSELKKSGLFAYGSAKLNVDKVYNTKSGYSGEQAIAVSWEGKESYGGWGKGITLNVELDIATDCFNFYFYNDQATGVTSNLRLTLQDDDNNDSKFIDKDDDSWIYDFKPEKKNEWQLISIPLSHFKDQNKSGDNNFNISYHKGKLLTFLMSFTDSELPKKEEQFIMDFITFSKGSLPTGTSILAPPAATENDFCNLGAWSEEGNDARYADIAIGFNSHFNTQKNNLSMVHFFYPFSAQKGSIKELYPSVEKINKVIHAGYKPMITLENHFLKVNKKQGQPNLYSIVEGHFDYFFEEWARQIKKVDGEVYLRILHEFNGNWYAWCIADNDKDPKLYVRAYKHIHNIFRQQQANNVKFIWCPNSMSVPQASWNFILDAYPGDQYVDFVALDVYNGAGEQGIPVWRSFRKETIESYFLLTQNFPSKPLFICETSSRERMKGEAENLQSKAEWIQNMSEALKSDLSKIRLIAWFNEDKYRVDSSIESKQSFTKYIWNDKYFLNDKYKVLTDSSENNK